ncbi:MAG TPA: CoA transferase [Candidatus Binataceae bacterium]|nr:CoA transferase [Candidatus Binataceae bacterium]
MLNHCRVLDLTNERGFLCGQILGDLGADVIKVEPPGGAPGRRLPPFLNGQPGLDNSIYWLAFNRNKRSLTLDLERPEGRELLQRMVARADFLLESETPGRMAELGLDYATLSRLNPALVYVSITPFGQDGPKAHYADSDLILMAASGVLILCGDEDRAPLRMSVPQAYLHASADAAGAALIAYYERLGSDRGQQVDVAAQESITLAGQSTALTALIDGEETRRMSGGAKLGALRVPLVWKCRDGLVTAVFLFGSALGPFSKKLVDYIHSQGGCDDAMKNTDWVGYGARLLSGELPLADYEQKQKVIANFLAARTKSELFNLAQQHGLLIAPLSTVEDLLANPQFKARNYWQPMTHPDGGPALTYPGPFARLSQTPIQYRRRPPRVGEHNREIFAELGLGDDALIELGHKGII